MIVIKRLIWDDWNIEYIARHQVIPAQVETACHSDFIILQGQKGRLVLVDPCSSDRILAVVLDPEPEEGTYYPVTAYTASRKLRAVYRRYKKGGESE